MIAGIKDMEANKGFIFKKLLTQKTKQSMCYTIVRRKNKVIRMPPSHFVILLLNDNGFVYCESYFINTTTDNNR